MGDKMDKKNNRSLRLDFNEASKRVFETHGDEIALLEFNGSHKRSLFECKEYGHRWYTLTYSVWKKNGCPFCKLQKLSKKFAFPIEEVKEYIESRCCQLISTEYKNVETKLDVIFECGHQGKISFECFKRGQRCAICGIKKNASAQRLSMEEINRRLSEKNLLFIDFPDGYENRSSDIICKCGFGHIETRKLSTVLKSSGCVQCSNIHMSIIKSGACAPNWQGGKTLLRSFLRKQIIDWKKESIKNCNYACILCGEGHRFKDVHHLYNFYTIIDDALEELNLGKGELVSEYSEETLFLIANKVIEIHKRHPLGVCLCRKHHKAFHHYFGLYDNTPEQFEEFKEKLASGEFILSDKWDN